MAHLAPPDPASFETLAPVLQGVRASMGFVPNSMLTMAHNPQLTAGFALLATVVFGGDLGPLIRGLADRVPAAPHTNAGIEPGLVQLIAFASSLSAGCRYCQAHTAHSAHRVGAHPQQLAEILDFEQSAAFTPAERAAVALAFAAARIPNESEAGHFERLRRYFSEAQIVQIVAVIALFGFLNRWNDTMATSLEDSPANFAREHLGEVHWDIGKHGRR